VYKRRLASCPDDLRGERIDSMYAILIPAFQPDETLYELTDQLSQTLTSSGSEIIIVDDGSESNDSLPSSTIIISEPDDVKVKALP